MRRRFFALGYAFFALLSVTGVIMAFSFIERVTNSDIIDTSELVEKALSDTVKILEDPAYVVENVSNDLSAALENFHYYPEVNFIGKDYRSNCLSCHTPLPHNENIKTRAFLNMHGGFIACATCHTDESDGEYQWYDIERNTFASALIEDIPLMSIQIVRSVSGAPAYVGQNDAEFSSTLTEEIKNDLSRKDALCKSAYRKDIDKALSCDGCHSTAEGELDWEKLGYSDERAEELMTLSIPNVFNKYDEFYIPSF